MLNAEQQLCVDFVRRGHNLTVLGQAGTGKTHVSKAIAREMQGLGKKVAITTSTGIAGKQYQFTSRTLHSWSGIKDGHLDGQLLVHSLSAEAVKNITTCDVLLVDEISMISKHTMEQVNYVCQTVRKSKLPMGGIQTVCIGDFYQLAPVPNKWNNDDGDYIFQSLLWEQLMPHKVVLGTIIRQDDPEFITIINETARGCPSWTTTQRLKTLNSTTPRDVSLYATKIDVYMANMECLESIPGNLYIFDSKDGENINTKMRKCVEAPSKLFLKVGAPVILIVNLSKKLVNGLQGIVDNVDTDKGSVSVHFTDLEETHNISKHSFFIFDKKTGKNIFVTEQIPLLLAYALTIHKSQGMTLNSAMVNCSGAFAPGQISVALGRVRQIKDITVKNFRPSLCPPHPPSINAFYGSPDKDFADNLSCCRNVVNIDMAENVGNGPGSEDESNLHESSIDEEEHYIEVDGNEGNMSSEDYNYPEVLTPNLLRERLRFPYAFTPMQHKINDCLTNITDDKLIKWGRLLYGKLLSLCQSKYTKPGDTRQINNVVHSFINEYGKSEEFYSTLRSVFEVSQLEEYHLSVGINALLKLQDLYFSIQAQKQRNDDETQTDKPELTHGGKAKCRYIAGMCVGKLLYKTEQYMYKNVHHGGTIIQEKKNLVSVLKGHLYNSLYIGEQETDYPDSLSEISHRQTKFGHLTIVDDMLFKVFLEFENIVFPKLTSNNLKKQKDVLFSTIINDALDHLFLDSSLELGAELTRNVLQGILGTYLKVSLKEMGLRLVSNMKVKKKWAHRKQVMLESKHTSIPCNISMTSQQESVPDGPITPSIEPVLPTPRASSPRPSTSHTEEITMSQSGDASNLEICSSDDLCSICGKLWKANTRFLWIECTECGAWLHRKCDELLKPIKVWKMVSQNKAPYSCPQCRNR